LLQHDAGFLEPGVGHRGADRTYACRCHAHVRIDKGQHAGPVIEGAGNHTGQVVPARLLPQTFAQAE
jgi:hypothetical protein